MIRMNATVAPKKFAHAVLRTKGRYDEMVQWYRTVLNARVVAQAPHMAFLSYDDEHHRIAIVNTPHASPRDPNAEGLDHLSFTYGSLAELLSTYARLKAVGIEPFCPVNHGPTTSLYYNDPDGFRVELQIDNLPMGTAQEFVDSPEGQANVVGVLIDPEELLRRYEDGEPVRTLVTWEAWRQPEPAE